jgi:hypothetical protein
VKQLTSYVGARQQLSGFLLRHGHHYNQGAVSAVSLSTALDRVGMITLAWE